MLVIDLMPLSCSKIFVYLQLPLQSSVASDAFSIFLRINVRRCFSFLSNLFSGQKVLCVLLLFFRSTSMLPLLQFDAVLLLLPLLVLLPPLVCYAACLPRPIHVLLLLLQLLAPESFVLWSFFSSSAQFSSTRVSVPIVVVAISSRIVHRVLFL